MPDFEVTAPNGKKYTVSSTNPNATEAEALAHFKTNVWPGLQKGNGAEDTASAAAPVSARSAEDASMAAYDESQQLDPVDSFLQKIGVRPAIMKLHSAVTGPTRSLISQVPFTDEVAGLAGGVKGVTSGEGFEGGYNRAVDREREAIKTFERRNPIAGRVLPIFGALGTLGPGRAITAPTAASAVPAVRPPLAKEMLKGGATATAAGSVYGFAGGTDGMENRMKNAAFVGGVSAPFGVMAPAVIRGGQNIGNWWQARQAAKQAGMSKPAYTILNRAMRADDSFTGQGAARLRQAGPDAMLADAGPGARSVLDTAIQKSGEAGHVATQAIRRRVDAAARRVTQALDRTLGKPRGIVSTERALRQGTAAKRSTAYDAAYSRPIDYSTDAGREIERIVRENVPRSALREANKLIRADSRTHAKQLKFSVGDDGKVVVDELPTVEQIDFITKGLNEVANRAHGAGKLGGTTTKGLMYENLSRNLRTLTKELVPEYATALNTAAGPIARRQALRFGERILRPGTTRDQVSEMLRGMSRAERQYAAAGVRAQIDEKLANIRRTMANPDAGTNEALATIKELSTRANREKVSLLVGQKNARRLFDELDRSAMSFDLRAGVAQNSKTFARQAMDETIKRQQGGPVSSLLEGHPIDAARGALRIATGKTPAHQQAVEDALYSELVSALVARRGPQAQGLLGNVARPPTVDPWRFDQAARAANVGPAAINAYLSGSTGLLGAR